MPPTPYCGERARLLERRIRSMVATGKTQASGHAVGVWDEDKQRWVGACPGCDVMPTHRAPPGRKLTEDWRNIRLRAARKKFNENYAPMLERLAKG